MLVLSFNGLLRVMYQMMLREIFFFFFIHMTSMWIFVVSHVYLLGWPASRCPFICQSVLLGKNIKIAPCAQTFQPNTCCICSTIDFYYFMSLFVTLILAGGQKVNTKQNVLT